MIWYGLVWRSWDFDFAGNNGGRFWWDDSGSHSCSHSSGGSGGSGTGAGISNGGRLLRAAAWLRRWAWAGDDGDGDDGDGDGGDNGDGGDGSGAVVLVQVRKDSAALTQVGMNAMPMSICMSHECNAYIYLRVCMSQYYQEHGRGPGRGPAVIRRRRRGIARRAAS